MVGMALLPTLGRTVGTGVKALRLVVRSSVRGSAWATRRVGTARAKGAANEVGMIRLFDLHAVSCAGDALIAIGLAGTIFSVPLGEARSQVGLYLLITMVPFALLAPVVGPLLDHFRHGRRYALATTMLGRAFLAYVMSDNLLGWGLYPAAFAVLAFSRAYGVARSAAVPRLLPAGVGLSQVGARASVYGTFAGILVAPIGLLAFKFGPQWPLRVATVIFMIGVVVALRLPPRADSDPPEEMPRPWRAVFRTAGSGRPLAERLVLASLIGSAGLRLLYGFLLLFLTFAIMGNSLPSSFLGIEMSRGAAVGVVGGALALGTFLSTAAGTGLRIRRPLALQSSGLVVTAGVAVLTTIFYNLAMVTLLALLTAIFSGIAKLAVDASIQERVPEQQRATAFAHSETVLMLAWVAGGGLGIIPLPGRWGIALAALLAVLAAARAAWAAARLHNERLAGHPDAGPSSSGVRETEPSSGPAVEAVDPWADAPAVPPVTVPPAQRVAGKTLVEPPAKRKRWPGRKKEKEKAPVPAPLVKAEDEADQPTVRYRGGDGSGTPAKRPNGAGAPPGYHVYRPSSATSPAKDEDL
jgi:MFS family permease